MQTSILFTMMKMFEERGTKKILKPDEIKLLGSMDVFNSEETQLLQRVYYIVGGMEDKLHNER